MKSLKICNISTEDDMSLIVDHLFVGCDSVINNLSLLTENRIGFIVNCTTNCPNSFPDKIQYLRIDVSDSPKEDISEYFEQCSYFIDQAKIMNSNCLVHCNVGMSRSAAFTLAYLMKYYQMNLIQALDFTRRRRPITAPNVGFMKQLLKLEMKLYGSISIDLEKYKEDCFASFEILRLSDSRKTENWELKIDEIDCDVHDDTFSDESPFSPTISLLTNDLTPRSPFDGDEFYGFSPHLVNENLNEANPFL